MDSHFYSPADFAKTVDPDRAIRKQRVADYPKEIWYFFASAIALIGLCHWISVLSTRLRRPTTTSSTRGQRGGVSVRRIPLAVLNTWRVLAFRCTIRVGNYSLNLAEVFLAAAYLAATFTWSLINSTSTIGVAFDPKYYANRAGAIAANQTNLIVALAMRNNIISLLTGVGYDKLNFLHRVTARTTCVLVWLHAGGRLQLGLDGNSSVENAWMRVGFMAAVALTLLSLFALRPIRESQYEIFKIIHFFTAVMFILGSYFHTAEEDVGSYVWPAILLWGLDRTLGLCRIALSATTSAGTTVDVLSPHFIRLSVNKPRLFRWRAGQSAYLTVPAVSLWQAHPFTIAYEEDSKLVFLIRVRKGFTSALMKTDLDSKARTLVDGPYSSPPMLHGCSDIVLIAGGSGVGFTLPLLLDAIARAQQGPAPYPRITFIWAIRDKAHVDWIHGPLGKALDSLPEGLSVKVEIYITDTSDMHQPEGQEWDDDSVHEVPSNEEDSNEKDGGSDDLPEKESAVVGSRSKVDLIYGARPDLPGILNGVLGGADGTVSVNVCGTFALANAVRASLSPPRFGDIVRGGPSVILHVETA